MSYRRSRFDAEDFVATTLVSLFLVSVAAFIRHIWWIITICMSGQPIVGGQVVLAIIGIVFPPVGALHGVWLWLN